jgi:uncharacterized protein (TIGR04222 family)
MNPFALPGPQFLLFYAIFAAIVLLLLYLARHSNEDGVFPNLKVTEPYLFACLNGGPGGVIRVATFGLVDRGLLVASGTTAHTVQNLGSSAGLVDIEQKVLQHFRGGASLESAWESKSLQAAAASAYEDRLRSLALVPNAAIASKRRLALMAALIALLGVSGVKLYVALSAGRGNVMLLVVMTGVAALIAAKIWNPYRTRLGNEYLASVRTLFASLKDRAATLRPGGATRDVLWLTALFGAGALSVISFPVAAHVWARPQNTGSSGCGSSGCGGDGGGGGGCGGCGGG